MDDSIRGRLTVALCCAWLIMSACGDTDSNQKPGSAPTHATKQPTNATSGPQLASMPRKSDPATPDWMEGRASVAAPWTHVLEEPVAREAIVKRRQIRFPDSVADDLPRLEKFDILVSGLSRQAFLRRVQRVRRNDGDIIVETSSAQITDAILRGKFDNSDAVRSWSVADGQKAGEPGQSDGSSSDPYRKSTQQLRNGAPEYTSLGQFSLEDFGATSHQRVSAPKDAFKEVGAKLEVRAEGTPNVSIAPRYWFSMEIDFESGAESPSSDYFFSTRKCTSDSDCFDGAGGGETCIGYDPDRFSAMAPSLASKLEEYDPENGDFTRYCAYTPEDKRTVQVREEGGNATTATEYQRCGELLEVLEWVQTEEGKRCYQDWANWYNNKGRQGARLPSSCRRSNRDAIAPFPSQLEWAKLVCDGSLTHAEFDLKNDVDAGVDDFQMDIEGHGSKAWPLVSTGDQVVAGIVFLVGEIPVVVTFNYSVTVPFAVNVGAGVELNPDKPKFVGIRDVTVPGGGFHYYASHDAYKKGHFGPPVHDRPRGYLDSLHFNAVDFNASPDFQAPTVGEAKIEGTATLAVIPEVSLLLYHTAGAYLEPMAPYATVNGSSESEPCHVGVEVGATGAVGLKAQLPFGLGTDEVPDASSRSKTPESADQVETKEQIIDFLSNTLNQKWMLYDTCGHGQFPIERFDWSLEGRSDINPARMCPEGIDGLCYRSCLYGSCSSDDESGDGSDGSGDGSSSGGGGGSGDDGTGASDDNGGRPVGSAQSPEKKIDKAPVAETFGCSSGGGQAPVAPWMIVIVLGVVVRGRFREV